MPGKFRVGDRVEVAVAICEVAGWDGQIVAISTDLENTMPYLVSLNRNLREWPFAEEELRSIYDEETV